MIDKRKLDEVVTKLKAEHEEIHLLTAGEHQVIVRPPTRGEYQRFKEMGFDEKKRTKAHETILRSCCVYPTPEELDALLEKRPALATNFGAKVTDIAGLEHEAEAKKL